MTLISKLRRAGIPLVLSAIGLALAPGANAQLARVTEAGRIAIVAKPATPFAGPAAADVTVVEYLDFNCPYCKKAAISLRELMATDPKVRILYKDWPIFGGVSIYAARVTLAANWQGKYLAAHNILIDTPSRLASETQVRERLAFAGIDLTELDRDLATHGAAIDAILERNDAEARALSFQGTPGLVIGDYLVPGALAVEDLRRLTEIVRRPPSRQ